MTPPRRTGRAELPADGTHIGEILDGRFALIRPLGRGGAATVWLAHDRSTMREVAVKMLHASLRGEERALERFARECEALLRLEHPGVSRLLEVKFDRERPYFAMERITGWTLEEELAQRSGDDRRFSDAEVLSLFSQLSSTLDHAHGRGIIHRDLKPSNIMLAAPDGREVKVLDFGIAKILEDGHTDATTKGRLLGSMVYMSPEQARGEALGPRSDVFALAVILFEVLTLRRPWLRAADGSLLRAYAEPVRMNSYNVPTELLGRIATAPRPRPSQVAPGVSPRLDPVVTAGLAIELAARPASAGALFHRLQEALGGDAGIDVTAVPTVPVAVWAPRRPKPPPVEEDEPIEETVGRTVPVGDELYSAHTLMVDRSAPDEPARVGAADATAVSERSALVALSVLSRLDGTPAADPADPRAAEPRAAPGPQAALLAHGPGYVATRPRRGVHPAWVFLGALGLVALGAGLVLALQGRDAEVVAVQLPGAAAKTTPNVVARATVPSATDRAASSTVSARAAGEPAAEATRTTPTKATRTPPSTGAARPSGERTASAAHDAKAAPPAGGALRALRGQLAALGEREASSAELSALAEAIAREAEIGGPDEVRTSVGRLARSSAKLGDLSGLERAIDLLARARKE